MENGLDGWIYFDHDIECPSCNSLVYRVRKLDDIVLEVCDECIPDYNLTEENSYA